MKRKTKIALSFLSVPAKFCEGKMIVIKLQLFSYFLDPKGTKLLSTINKQINKKGKENQLKQNK